MEARVDAVFASIRTDPEFMTLTAHADGKRACRCRRTEGRRVSAPYQRCTTLSAGFPRGE